jgi:hypothetical protein
MAGDLHVGGFGQATNGSPGASGIIETDCVALRDDHKISMSAR